MRPTFAAAAFAAVLGACASRGPQAPAPTAGLPAPLPSDLGCVAVVELNDSDGDLARVSNASLAGLCVETARFYELGRFWVVQRYRSNRPGPLWVVPHDDEDSAFVSGIAALNRYGGILVALDNNGWRSNDGTDPNRIFGAGGTCRPAGSAPVAPRYTAEMLRDRDASQPIIALHTNGRGYAGDGFGGAGNTSIHVGGRYRTPYPALASYPGSASPSDTLTFVAGRSQMATGANARLIAQLNMRGINVIYEYVARAWTDCSLSNYALLNRLGFYINIETLEGDSQTQLRIIDEVMRLLGAPASPPVVG